MDVVMIEDLEERSRTNMILFYRDELTRLHNGERVMFSINTRRNLHRLGILEYTNGSARTHKQAKLCQSTMEMLDLTNTSQDG